MSGLVAVLNLDGAPVDRRLLGTMADALAFRGPDAQHIWTDGQVGLGHTLLATVDDFPEPAQPCSMDGRIWIVADARIDGRSELMARLQAKIDGVGVNASDPELILHAYAAWGDACVDHLLGDFAFVIWDGDRQRLFAARDHFGVKPLYYARTGRVLLISNTADCLRLHPLLSNQLNEQVVGDFLLFGELIDPATTAFSDIHRVPAAHTLSWNDASNSVRVERYWTLPIDEPLRFRDPSEYGDLFAELLRNAVADRMRTPRISIFMSGGLDSSTVAAVAGTLSLGSSRSFRAHTIVYDELIPDDERHYAGQVAQHLGIPIEFLAADHYELFQDPTWSPRIALGPASDPLEALHLDARAQVAARSRVALTGYGGDPGLLPWPSEVFHQLKHLRVKALLQSLWVCIHSYKRVPRIGLRSALRRPSPPDRSAPWLQPDFAARLNIPERQLLYTGTARQVHPFRRSAYRSLTAPFWDYLLENLDAVATRQPLEHRHPFLDIRLVRYLLSVPTLPWCVDKHLLRESVKGNLPEEVRLRRKTPMSEDAVLSRLRKRKLGQLAHFAPAAELSRFVTVDQIVKAGALGSDAVRLWTNLRPYSVSFWLSTQGGISRAQPAQPFAA